MDGTEVELSKDGLSCRCLTESKQFVFAVGLNKFYKGVVGAHLHKSVRG